MIVLPRCKTEWILNAVINGINKVEIYTWEYYGYTDIVIVVSHCGWDIAAATTNKNGGSIEKKWWCNMI